MRFDLFNTASLRVGKSMHQFGSRFLANRRFALAVVGLALLVNSLAWAVRFPPLHPNDEPQHYMYAALFDGVGPGGDSPSVDEVPRDLQALAEMVDFGPHRETRRTIPIPDEPSKQWQHLRADADNPALAGKYVEDTRDQRLVPHPNFTDYHPPVYYAIVGQVLGLAHDAGLGLRWRLLAGRAFSVCLGLLAAWLAVLLVRLVWPDRWAAALLAGLAVGMHVLVAFYTSVMTNEVLAYVLLTAFMLLGAKLILSSPKWYLLAAMVAIGLLAVATKITMVVVWPMGLIAVMLSGLQRKVKVLAGLLLAVSLGFVLLVLLIPIDMGGSMVESYVDDEVAVRSVPSEMFSLQRFGEHLRMFSDYWGRSIGNTVSTNAYIPYRMHNLFAVLMCVALFMGGGRLRRITSAKRRVVLWLLTAPGCMAILFYAIDYRMASLYGGWFAIRGQYYIPVAAAQMAWLVWGLVIWLRGRALVCVGGLLGAVFPFYNIWVLFGVVSPRYYDATGWWAQCGQIAQLWPVPAWGVALLDGLALGLALLASCTLFAAFRAEAAAIAKSKTQVGPDKWQAG